MMKRLRVLLRKERVILAVRPRPKEYLCLRYHWLHELRQLRAKRKYGTASKKDIKIAQRELARIRRDHV
jgi:hypothetical protein